MDCDLPDKEHAVASVYADAIVSPMGLSSPSGGSLVGGKEGNSPLGVTHSLGVPCTQNHVSKPRLILHI